MGDSEEVDELEEPIPEAAPVCKQEAAEDCEQPQAGVGAVVVDVLAAVAATPELEVLGQLPREQQVVIPTCCESWLNHFAGLSFALALVQFLE